MAYVFQLFVICITSVILNSVEARKILLQDLKTLTLRHGEMTTSRRSSPVPQLKCVGGTAGCSSFVPQHVQCYNRGSDGYDIQWECKTDMDNKYRFGKIDVSCEGYDYADDPYVLAGSCGLEYAIDRTGSGGSSSGYNSYSNSKYGYNTEQTSFGSAFGFICVIMMIFFVYRTCYSGGNASSTYPNMSSSGQFGGGAYPSAPPPPYSSTPPNDPPPPYGFRPEYQQQQPPKQYPTTGQQQQQDGPGFFSGMLAGGLMGYLFGNNRSGYGNGRSSYFSDGYQRDWFGSPVGGGGGSLFGGGGSSFGGGSSSGSRTTSGFGGTKRR